jgi:protein SCO1/2
MKLAFHRGALVLALLPLLLSTACRRSPKLHGEVMEGARKPELAGVNWDGHPYSLSDHRGKVGIVFFGYTYCPDVCPFTLAR